MYTINYKSSFTCMSSSDKKNSVAIAIIILIHVTILAIGPTIATRSFLIALLNLIASSSFIIYWTQKQLRITQHFIELREIAVLSFEVIAISFSVYYMFQHQQIQWLNVVNFIVFGTHILVLLLLLVIMLTFKMKKLF